jgi:hypothetical protein
MERTRSSDSLCDDDILSVVDIHNIDCYITLNDVTDDEIDVFDMASLSNFMLLGHTYRTDDPTNPFIGEDDKLHRLSLAYERLHTIPKLLLQEVAPVVKILDISNNEFE